MIIIDFINAFDLSLPDNFKEGISSLSSFENDQHIP